MYIVGKIVNTHGIRGEVKIINMSDFDRFSIGSKIYYHFNKEDKELEIENLRSHKGQLIVKLKGYDNINDVLFLKGLDVFVYDKVIDNKDSYYYADLIGLSCYTTDNVLIGIVKSVLEVPQGHILEIFNNDKKTLIPFVNEFVKEIDEKKIIIKPIEGLL
ncbi:ribosome maturation factor RimM [Acholeplasma sp. OttesenSCG-928-E16]|nr:ribosome maturation factor RimM [Acholeplasma sp. OttesenSCG-928-E16]